MHVRNADKISISGPPDNLVAVPDGNEWAPKSPHRNANHHTNPHTVRPLFAGGAPPWPRPDPPMTVEPQAEGCIGLQKNRTPAAGGPEGSIQHSIPYVFCGLDLRR
jgi:hypothetical protein